MAYTPKLSDLPPLSPLPPEQSQSAGNYQPTLADLPPLQDDRFSFYPKGDVKENLKKILNPNFMQDEVSPMAKNIGAGMLQSGARTLESLPNIGKGAAQLGKMSAEKLLGKSGQVDKPLNVYEALGLKDSPFYTKEGAQQLFGELAPISFPAGSSARARAIDLVDRYFPTTPREVRDMIVHGILRSHYTPEQLAENLQAVQGTQSSLGSVIGNPILQHFQENVLGRIPGSGASTSLQNTGRSILDRGEHLVEQYAEDVHPNQVSSELGQELEQAAINARTEKNRRYAEANDHASEAGLVLRLPNFTRQAQQHIDQLNNSSLMQFEPDARRMLTRLANYTNPVRQTRHVGSIVDEAGNPIINETTNHPPSLQEANIMAGRLRQEGHRYSNSASIPDRNMGRVLLDLASALKGDVRQSVRSSNHQPLIDSFNGAEHYYGDQFADFLDKDMLKFTSGQGRAEDILSTFIKSSNTSDKAQQLELLMKHLSPRGRNLARYGYFNRAYDGTEDVSVINPNKLKSLWKNLGDNQKQALVPDREERRAFDHYMKLVEMNPRATNIMFNPTNGQINSDIVMAYMAMHPTKAISNVIKAQVANRFLTNGRFRNSVVESLIRRKVRIGQ